MFNDLIAMIKILTIAVTQAQLMGENFHHDDHDDDNDDDGLIKP